MNISDLENIDSSFNESTFITKVNNIFVRLFTCIMMNTLEEVKHFVSGEVYSWSQSIVARAKESNARQMYDELNVKESSIRNITDMGSYFQIEVKLTSRYMDYLIDLDTGKFISGINNHRIEVPYLLTFTKKKDAKDQGIARKCPGCGAPLSVNTSGKCDYCGATYNQEDYDWVLIKIEKEEV